MKSSGQVMVGEARVKSRRLEDQSSFSLSNKSRYRSRRFEL